MNVFVKYYKKTAYVFVILIILIFFYSVNHEHILGNGKTGILLKCFTILIITVGVFALSALILQKYVVKYLTGQLLIAIIVVGILSNVFLFNKLSFQELPAIRRITDNSMVTFNNSVVTYSNLDYPIYFYCNEKYPNSVLYANLQILNNYGISTELLKAWGGIKEINNTEKFPELLKDFLKLPGDTLTVIGNTIFLADKYVQPCLNDTIYFIVSNKKFYITGK